MKSDSAKSMTGNDPFNQEQQNVCQRFSVFWRFLHLKSPGIGHGEWSCMFSLCNRKCHRWDSFIAWPKELSHHIFININWKGVFGEYLPSTASVFAGLYKRTVLIPDTCLKPSLFMDVKLCGWRVGRHKIEVTGCQAFTWLCMLPVAAQLSTYTRFLMASLITNPPV